MLHKALKLIRAIVQPEDGTSYPAYRSSLAASFLFEFLFSLVYVDSSNINGSRMNFDHD